MKASAKLNVEAMRRMDGMRIVLKSGEHLPSFDGMLGIGFFPAGTYTLEVEDEWDSYLVTEDGQKKHVITQECEFPDSVWVLRP